MSDMQQETILPGTECPVADLLQFAELPSILSYERRAALLDHAEDCEYCGHQIEIANRRWQRNAPAGPAPCPDQKVTTPPLRKRLLIASLATAAGLLVALVGYGAFFARAGYAEDVVKALFSSLGLDKPLRFLVDDREHPSEDTKMAQPFVVVGRTMCAMGWADLRSIQRVSVERHGYPADPSVKAEWETEQVFPESDSAQRPGLPQSQEFRIPVPLPADDLIRVVTLRFHKRDGTAVTYENHVRCTREGPVAYVEPGIGKPLPDDLKQLDVNEYYMPSGFFGDVGDISMAYIEKEDRFTGPGHRFTYEPLGRGPHEYKYKFTDGQPNPNPANFAGCMWLNPANNFGDKDGGYDLGTFKPSRIRWSARSIGKPISVRFFVGSLGEVWGEVNGKHALVPAPYKDTLEQHYISEGAATQLEPEWEKFTASLDHLSAGQWQRVVCAFGWIILRPADGEKQEFEVRDIQFEW